jgi:hypothetical protein
MQRLVVVVVLFSVVVAGAASARDLSRSPVAGCRFVTKVVHGKKKRVRVCTKPKPPVMRQAVSVAATIPLGVQVGAIAASDSAVWVLSDDGRLFRVDPVTNKVVATISLPAGEWPEAYVAVGDGAVWVTVASPDTIKEPQFDSLLRIDPQTNQIVARIHVGDSPEGIGVTSDSIWTANHRSSWDAKANEATGIYDVSRVSVATNREVVRPVVETRKKGSDPHAYWCCGPQGMTFAAGSIWITDPQDSGKGLVVRVDPATDAVIARIAFANGKADACGNMVGDDSAVWFASNCDNPYVARIDPKTNQVVATINAGASTQDIALGFGAVWATTTYAVIRIDPTTNRIVGRTKLLVPTAVATGAGAVWVGDGINLLRTTPR